MLEQLVICFIAKVPTSPEYQGSEQRPDVEGVAEVRADHLHANRSPGVLEAISVSHRRLYPVSQLHHDVESCQHGDEMVEGVRVRYPLFLIVYSISGALAARITLLCLVVFGWDTPKQLVQLALCLRTSTAHLLELSHVRSADRTEDNSSEQEHDT